LPAAERAEPRGAQRLCRRPTACAQPMRSRTACRCRPGLRPCARPWEVRGRHAPRSMEQRLCRTERPRGKRDLLFGAARLLAGAARASAGDACCVRPVGRRWRAGAPAARGPRSRSTPPRSSAAPGPTGDG
jgi:hypothetical protein